MSHKLIPQDFELVSGNDKTLKFNTKDQDGKVVDLSGATIIWAMANSAQAKKKIIEYTSPVQVSITAPATDGLFEVDILDTDTEALKGGDYYHEAKVTSAGGLKTTVAIGTVLLRDNIIDT